MQKTAGGTLLTGLLSNQLIGQIKMKVTRFHGADITVASI
jgi:hypothetical protein